MIRVIVVKKGQAVSDGYTPVYIGRPSTLGNPFVIGRDGTRDEVIEKHKAWMLGLPKSHPANRAVIDLTLRALQGERLALVCFCAPEPCHGDYLAYLIGFGVNKLRGHPKERAS